MKFFAILSVVLALANAYPSGLLAAGPTFYTATVPLTSQYHAQDAFGQYSYGYSGGLSAKTETKSIDGVTRGAYSFIDADGKLQTVEYTADSLNGFRAAATNLPKSPIDTNIAPEPVKDTPEVAKAKADHLAAFKEAEKRAAENPEESQNETSNLEENKNDEEKTQQENSIVKELHSQSLPLTATTFTTLHAGPKLALDGPATSYSYRIEPSSYAYSLGSHVVSAPLAYTLASPLIAARGHGLTLNGNLIAEHGLTGLNEHNGINSY